MQKLILYTTDACHLCDEAEELLNQLKPAHRFDLQLVDISTSEELMNRYGNRIPVVQRVDNGSELGWPFDSTALLSWIFHKGA
ncbi:MAG: glutaredoxin family protein [Gammaproteobacteria bacterium]|jgi:glutaredoxin|nr:hypothetical protein [Gammaproteobacteria bacterium]MDP6097580.1 glutaredoxin family protein [Gammaproteobacteria bacterium]HJO11513.1 glutaredoxin family protein [Gammaproteobacteria bacterium]|tara:strand:+ start:219 stop:467 length:249 start_codon:yes stop_codon:yes gene_type:complete